MPKANAITSLSGLIDTEMDEDTQITEVGAMPTPDSNQENAARPKKGRAKRKRVVQRVTKARAPARRASGGAPAAKKPASKKVLAKKAPLQEQRNKDNANDAGEADERSGQAQDDLDDIESIVSVVEPVISRKQPTRRNNTNAKAGPKTKSTVQQVKATEKDGEFEYTPTAIRQNKLTTKCSTHALNPTVGKRKLEIESRQHVIPETQPQPMDIDQLELVGPDAEDEDDPAPQSVFRQASHARATSRQRQVPVVRRRAGSASDTERAAGDPSTRRKLGEMTKKFENLDLKYRNLREVGIKEAEANFDKLKEQTEAKTKVTNELILSLKKELATQKAIAQESRALQRQVTAKEAELTTSQSNTNQLSTALAEAHNENKALQAKLANARSASTAVESASAKTPGSVMKNKGPARTIMVGSAEAAQAAQIAQLKEDLYSDLTGLILRGIERGEEADIYDCLQTGRNGTLHFKLEVVNDGDGKGSSYEDTEFQYVPRLDSNRDRDLLEILPDYLSDEITFSRANAAKFYSRVVETLTKKQTEN